MEKNNLYKALERENPHLIKGGVKTTAGIAPLVDLSVETMDAIERALPEGSWAFMECEKCHTVVSTRTKLWTGLCQKCR